MAHVLERRNREIWEGHSHIFEDVTHTIGGVGLGLLLYPLMKRRYRSVGTFLVLVSAGLHVYAAAVKPRRGVLGRARAAIRGIA